MPVRVASTAPVPRNGAPEPKAVPATFEPGPKTYTVQAGDTLFAISQRFGTALNELMRVNNLSARSVIQPGLKLRLP